MTAAHASLWLGFDSEVTRDTESEKERKETTRGSLTILRSGAEALIRRRSGSVVDRATAAVARVRAMRRLVIELGWWLGGS